MENILIANKINFPIGISKFTILLFILFSEIACSKIEKNEILTININNDEYSKIHLGRLTESKKEIALENSTESMLGRIVDVKFLKDKIIVFDLLSGIHAFDSTGKFITKIGKNGEGPGEYKYINSMEINNDFGLIYIASMYKLLIYSSDFSFLEEKKFPFALTHLEFVKGELLVFSDKNGVPNDLGFMNISLLYKLSDSFTVKDSLSIRSVLLHNKSVGAYFFQHYISEIKDEVLFYKPVLTNENILRDTLFKIEGNKIHPFAKFQFRTGQSLEENGMKSTWIYNIISSFSYFLVEYENKGGRKMYLYNKDGKTGYHFKDGILSDDGVPVFLRPLDLENDIFYYLISSEFSDISIEEMNPKIVLVKLKKNIQQT